MQQSASIHKKRVVWIDISRGIAIISVIIGHSLGNYFPNYLASVIFAFHMPIFFILSGYLYREKSFSSIFKNNFFNLILPYFAVILIETVILIVCRFLPNPLLYSRFGSLKQLLFAAIYGIGGAAVTPWKNNIPWIGAIWFLLAMFFGSQIFNLIMQVKFKQHNVFYRGLLVLLLAFLGAVSAHYLTLPFSLNAALMAQVFFFTGYLIREYKVLTEISNYFYVILVLVWLLSSTTGLFTMSMATSNNVTFVSVIGGVVGSLCVMRFSMALEKHLQHNVLWLQRVLVFWGSRSLIILCFHLVDLDSVQLWPHVIAYGSRLFPYWGTIILGISYRIIFASCCALIMPYLPGFRNLFMHRNYPIRIKK
ncbi:acyltransferase family protein [Loigolactobacillus coryniformis]|uniref:acyltransferase family protein n=1 Tax=Loigolactobacillus coryniformis TaxID=1610 RepID=UPI00201A717C|nr:acyltransferase family protein [Loigolactobacillus coryniformis]MCL5459431.1 acyltransferase family protein [Loigolactobacillus coryniformis]